MRIGRLACTLVALATFCSPLACAQKTGSEEKPAITSHAVKIDGPPRVPGTWPVRRPLPEITDPEIAGAHALLIGSFASEPLPGAGADNADIPALVYNSARIDITGLDNAVYFEIARADAAWKPFRQGVLHLYKQGSATKLRIFDFGGPPSFNNAVVGLWLVTDLFPAVDLAQLVAHADMPLTKSGSRYEGKTPGRVPVNRHGAIEFEAAFAFSPDQITMSDRGYDAAGKAVFGLKADKSIVFKTADPPFTLRRTEEGLAIIDILAPSADGPKASKDSDNRIAVHYTGWLQTDGWKFASSKDPRWDGVAADPQLFNLRARLLTGWTEGMPGMTRGGIRRLVIPSGMAFHTTGSQPWRIPPDTGLIFEVDCLWVEDKPPAPVEEHKADDQHGEHKPDPDVSK